MLRVLSKTNGPEGVLALGELTQGYVPQPHHAELIKLALEAIYTRTHTLILEPAGAAKTTWGDTILLSWLVGMFRNVRVGLFSQTAEFSEAFSGAIMGMIEGNDEYRAVFGDLLPVGRGKWTIKGWHARGSRWVESKDFTLFAGGTGGQVASKRFDVLLCDDILGEENTLTPEQREKVQTWFIKSLFPRLVSNGVCIAFGTRWAEDDLYATMMKPTDEGGLGFKTIVKSAVVDVETDEPVDFDETPRERWRSYWESVWPLETLLQRRAMNPAQFDCTYQNNIEGLVSGDTFQKVWFRWYGTPDGDPEEELPRDATYTKRMGVDLASSVKTRADWTARVTTAEQWNTGDFYVMQAHRDRIPAGHDEFIDQGYQQIPGIGLVICENQAFQSTVITTVMNEKPHIPIVGRKTDTDKRTRAKAVAEKFKYGKVYLHRSLKDSWFERELLAFDGVRGHDDGVDALGFSMELMGGSFFFGAVPSR
jgi:phage terminase large subunit-like protein